MRETGIGNVLSHPLWASTRPLAETRWRWREWGPRAIPSRWLSRVGTRAGRFSRPVSCSSPFLVPFAPSPLQGLLRYYDTSDSPVAFLTLGVSPLPVPRLPRLPPPPTRCQRTSLSPLLMFSVSVRPRLHGNRLRSFPSRLALTTGRIEFLIVRTSRSFPAALHLRSHGRSYVQLPPGQRTGRRRTFTSLTRHPHGRTRARWPSAPRTARRAVPTTK